MNRILCILVLAISPVSFATSNSCSIENSQKLLNLSARVIGEMAEDQRKLNKVILDEKVVNSKEIRQQYIEIKKNSKSGKAAEEVMTFANAHPECDPQGNFRIIHPYK